MDLPKYKTIPTEEEEIEIPPIIKDKEESDNKILNLKESNKKKKSLKLISSNKKKKKNNRTRNSVIDEDKEKKEKVISKTFNKEEEENVKIPNEIRKFSLIYSPRTTYSKSKKEEDKLFQELSMSFDPITIKILKSHFKERLGTLSKLDFIGICKNHLLSWHPDLPNRKNIIIKLLNKLFKEIDLNKNGKIEWEEFTNYIIHNSNNEQNNNIAYSLRHYSMSKHNIDDSDFTEIVSFAFYIEKYNIIGLVQDSKSIIQFYDGSTMNKLKCEIDIKETQREINELEINDLNNRAKDLIKKEEEEKRIKKKIHDERNIMIRNSIISTPKNKGSIINILEKNFVNNNKNIDDIPESLRLELQRLKTDNLNSIKNSINKKLTVLTTEFIPEYDTLLISSSNNKISAWKYIENEFKNVNKISDNIIDKNNFSCAILSTPTPQYTMSWDPMQKYLYSGQMDGKILKWDLTKSNNLENEILDFPQAKIKHDLEMKGVILRNPRKTKTVISTNTQISNTVKINDNNDEHKNLRGEKLLDKMKKDNKKRDSVSCICILGKLQLLAAGYYNGNVILWDTMLKDYRKYYIDQDTCIYQIIYDQNKNLIYTCGFDHNIFIYDPYIDGNAVYKLVGHNISINSIAINPIEEELISIDIVGNIKIWDINNFYNFQSINVNESYTNKKVQQDINNSKKKKISSNLKMIFLTKSKKILTYGDKNLTFEADSSQNPNLADDQLILGSYYNYISYEFIIICLKRVKIWNVFNGKVERIYDNIMNNNEITSYVTDKTLIRLYLGDNQGKIKCININKGVILKEFQSHNGEIIGMTHSDKYCLLITLSNDGILKIHNDKLINESEVIKEIEMIHPNISSITISDEYSRLIMGLDNGYIKFFNIEHIRFDSEVDNERDRQLKGDQIISMISLPNIPIVCTSHESGRIKFIIIPPNINKFYWFGMFKNICIKEDKEIYPSVKTMDINKEKKILFTGDQSGFITCYSLSNIYDTISNKEINKDIIEKLENIKIKKIYCIQAHKETIKNIIFPNIKPNILITTSNDRECKLFLAENGEFIDELKQIASKYKDVPIGIKYYYADPFKTKRNSNEEIETGIIYRKDIEKNKGIINNNLIQQLRKENPIITNYAKAVTAANAKERLYLITKNSEVPYDKSNIWNYYIDIENIENEEKRKFEIIYNRITLTDNNIEKDSKLMQIKPIYSQDYIPAFIDDLSEDNMKDFSSMLSQKLRHVKLAMNKIKLEKNAVENFKREDKRKQTISLKLSIEMLNQDKKKEKIKKLKINLDKNSSRKEMFGINKRRIKSFGEQLDFYKEDFNKGLNELKFSIEKNIVQKYLYPIRSNHKLILPKILSRNVSELTEPNVHAIH